MFHFHEHDQTVATDQVLAYRRMATQVYDLGEELDNLREQRLVGAPDPAAVDVGLRWARAYFNAALLFQTVADAWIADAIGDGSSPPRPVPAITRQQVEGLYGGIPDLITRARQEGISSGSTALMGPPHVPVPMATPVRGEGRLPTEHLLGMRRAAEAVENLVTTTILGRRQELEAVNAPADVVDGLTQAARLIHQGIRTRRQAADDITGALMTGNAVVDTVLEQAARLYWDKVFADGLRALQELACPSGPTPRAAPLPPPVMGAPAPPAPPANGLPTPSVVVTPGSRPTLEDAIHHAHEGCVIGLRPGRHVLHGELKLQRALTLMGMGADSTAIVGDSGSAALTYEGAGFFGLLDVTVSWMGSDAGDVVVASSGEIRIERCAFTASTSGKGTTGVWLKGTARGHVAHCEASGLAHGIVASHTSQATLEANTCQRNSHYGIEFEGQSTGSASGNICASNGASGIDVNQNAQATLEANRCQRNSQHGVYFRGQSRGTAHGNECTDNGKDGIAVAGAARPELRGNICQSNALHGVNCWEQASATVDGNTCEENGDSGIAIFGSGQSNIENNVCRRNKQYGIYFGGAAAGTAIRNTCAENQQTGILLYDTAQPTLEGNTCQHNKVHGIQYRKEAGGMARHNTCADNEQGGLTVSESTQPTLLGNTCQRNKHDGILFKDHAGGTASNNTCTDNGGMSIKITDDAQPTLTDNITI